MIVEQMLNNAPNPLLHIADVSGSALFQGDCLEIMPLIPDKSVQLILADLPYGKTNLKWDNIIPLEPLWKEYKRIIKDNGAIILTSTQPFTTTLISSNIKDYKYSFIWEKSIPHNFIRAKKEPLLVTEDICVFGKNILYNPTTELKHPKNIRNSTTRYDDKQRNKDGQFNTLKGVTYNSKRIIPTDEKYTSNVLNFKSVGNNNKNRLHPTQKPLELMKNLILKYSNVNDMILDNTMGSGTTCLAAKELNRKFIGIEKEPKYYDIACQRCGF